MVVQTGCLFSYCKSVIGVVKVKEMEDIEGINTELLEEEKPEVQSGSKRILTWISNSDIE